MHAHRPLSVRIAFLLLVLEGLAGGAAAAWSVGGSVATGGYLPAALALGGIFALLGALVALAGRAVLRGDRWGRSVGVTCQAFLGLGAWALVQSGLTAAAVPVAALAIAALWALLTPSTTAHLVPSERSDDGTADGSRSA
jgi:hypothetical protein